MSQHPCYHYLKKNKVQSPRMHSSVQFKVLYRIFIFLILWIRQSCTCNFKSIIMRDSASWSDNPLKRKKYNLNEYIIYCRDRFILSSCGEIYYRWKIIREQQSIKLSCSNTICKVIYITTDNELQVNFIKWIKNSIQSVKKETEIARWCSIGYYTNFKKGRF